MKHTTGPRRGRSRGNGKRFSAGGGGKNQTFESSGPDVKIRGTAQQIYEKYLSLARDAVSAGDRITAEGLFQFADHYYRIFSAANGNAQPRNDQNNRIPSPPESAAGNFDGEDEAAAQESREAGNGDADDGATQESEPQRPADEFRPRRPGAPRRPRVAEETADAAPAAQAEELAEALARSEENAEADGQTGDEPVAAAEAAEDKPRRGRRTLGLNLGGRRTLGRRSQRSASEKKAEAKGNGGDEAPAETAEPDASADVPSAESREDGLFAPKPVRRRTRRTTTTKTKEPAGAA